MNEVETVMLLVSIIPCQALFSMSAGTRVAQSHLEPASTWPVNAPVSCSANPCRQIHVDALAGQDANHSDSSGYRGDLHAAWQVQAPNLNRRINRTGEGR